MHSHPPVPHAAINRHGVIGDRRTAALVAADGTIDWFSLLDYDGNVIFGCLLDAQKGGYWHLGPGIRHVLMPCQFLRQPLRCHIGKVV
jgi:GH15 family glucan-1,4-alpha-glucosidase